MKLLNDGNWGLKILSLVLAIVIYHALKSETAGGQGNQRNNDRHFFQSH